MKNNVFGNRLKELRLQNGLTLQQLAEITFVSFSVIGFWERGESDNPSIKPLIALADYFDVSIDYLVGRKEDY